MKHVAVLGLLLILGAADANGEGGSVAEHAVIVRFGYGSPDWSAFFEFEKVLETAVDQSGLGEYDGNELAVDGSDGTLYMYGPDADVLFQLVRPYLEGTALLKNIAVTLRYGSVDDPKAKETVVHIGT